MKLIPHISKILTSLVLASSLLACTDDKLDDPTRGGGFTDSEINLEEYMAVPLSIDCGVFPTRADFVNGTGHDHSIDFENGHETFAIFFDQDNKFVTVKRLQTYNAFGNGGNPGDGIGEYAVYALSYLHRDSIPEQLKVLVVLNGGRIYDQMFKEDTKLKTISTYLKALSEQDWARDKEGNLLKNENGESYRTPIDVNITQKIAEITTTDFLNFIWKSEYSKDGVIGINDDGRFTMTNSAYFGPDDEKAKNVTEDKYTLQTVRNIDMTKIVEAKAENITPANSAATIYVERMVAKFSPPAFSTEVIGSERFFRPSQNALSMIIYGFNSNNQPISEQRNWRVHVLGWTVNGRERANYLFKHIEQIWGQKNTNGSYNLNTQLLPNWGRSQWNEPAKRRSYWSVDPHYSYNNENGDFYPWQFREALDNPGHSLWGEVKEIKKSEDEEHNDYYDYIIKEDTKCALRYFNFHYLAQYWSEEPLTISENTFDPDYMSHSKDEYDDRAQILVGPHLLVGAEVFVEDPKAAESEYNYIGQFIRPAHLYSDRLGRFYFNELDWFKMFVRDFNNALRAQNQMSFTVYNWDEEGDMIHVRDKEKEGANQTRFTVYPTGTCRLFYDPTANGASIPENDPRHKYINQELTLDLIDQMIKEEIINPETDLSIESKLRNSDGKRIPWLEGLVVRNIEGERLKVLPAIYSKEDAEKIKIEDAFTWTDDMRKSLFYEWFGEVNHYANGAMYYAAPIIHHRPSGVQSDKYFYGAVRNHWYTFTVSSINALGIPVDNEWQPIIPGKYNYEGMISCYIDIIDWHSMTSEITYN